MAAVIDLDKGGRIPQGENVYLGPSLGWKRVDKPIDVEFVLSGGGSAIAPGFKGILQMPEWLYIYSWAIQSDQLGDIAFDVFRISYEQAQAQVPIDDPAWSIVGTDPPTMTAARFAEHILPTNTSWARDLAQNDMVGFKVTTPLTVLFRCSIILRCMTLKGVW